MSGKLIHILGGGINQIPLVEKAKSFGLRTLVTDMYEDPPARKHADFFESIDITDIEKTLECARRHKIDYITSDMTDVGVPTVAYIAEKLGLPGIGYETALKFTNKFVMRSALKEKMGAHLPEFHFFDNVEDALKQVKELPWTIPYIVKPVNAQGSKGVSVLSRFGNALNAQIWDTFRESRERGILVERFIGGFEYSVETFVRDGNVHNLTITKKYHYKDNTCLDERNTWLGDVAPSLEAELFAVNEQIIKTLGLKFGMTHAEYKVDDGRIYLMEIAARGAGGSISSHIIPYLTDFDAQGALLSYLLGRDFDIKIKNYKERFAILKFYNFKPGKTSNVVIDQKSVEQALVFSFVVRPGDEIRPVNDSRDRPGYFVVMGATREEVLKKEKILENAVQVEYAATATRGGRTTAGSATG